MWLQALPIFLDRLADPVTAVLISITVVLIFGECEPLQGPIHTSNTDGIALPLCLRMDEAGTHHFDLTEIASA